MRRSIEGRHRAAFFFSGGHALELDLADNTDAVPHLLLSSESHRIAVSIFKIVVFQSRLKTASRWLESKINPRKITMRRPLF